MKNFDQAKKQVVELLMVANDIKPKDFDSEYRVLYVVEGHSASSGIRSKRKEKVVGVLALRGKILNCWGRTLSAAMRSEVVKEFLTVMRNSNTAYNRVIITTDADPDGSHITTLLISLCVKFMPDLIKEGKLFLCDTPFYTFKLNNETIDWGQSVVMPPSHLAPYTAKLSASAKTSFKEQTGLDVDTLTDDYINQVDSVVYKKNMDLLEKMCKIKGSDCKGLGSYTYDEIKKFILYPSLGATLTKVTVDKNTKLALDTSMLRGCKEWLKIDDDANRYGDPSDVSIENL